MYYEKENNKFFLVLVFVITTMCTVANADGFNPADEDIVALDADPVQGVDYVYFQGSSGTWYYVNFASDYVGDAYSAYSDVNGVCQAFINGCLIRYGSIHGVSVTTIKVDKWCGKNTKEALTKVQGYCGVTADSICGPNTWRGMYSYSGCTIGGSLGSGVTSTIKSYL